MPISVDCPTCGKTLRAKDSAAGKTAKCPSCEGLIMIPEVYEVYDAEESTEPDDEFGSHEEAAAPALPVPAERPCPVCGEKILKKAKKCRHCGEFLDDDAGAGASRRTGSKARSRRSNRTVADLGKRFLAALADGLVGLICIVPGLGLIIAANPDAPQPDEGFMIGGVLGILVGGLVILVCNIYLLATRSQSIGKWLTKIQIIDIETDEPAGFVKAWVLRSFVNGLIGAIPYIGSCYGLIDILMIFGEERRCVHDQIAGTYVADIS